MSEYMKCAWCDEPVEINAWRKKAVDRAVRLGNPVRVFCNQRCDGHYWNRQQTIKRKVNKDQYNLRQSLMIS